MVEDGPARSTTELQVEEFEEGEVAAVRTVPDGTCSLQTPADTSALMAGLFCTLHALSGKRAMEADKLYVGYTVRWCGPTVNPYRLTGLGLSDSRSKLA